MTHEGENHWARLASELGAEPPAPQPEGPKQRVEEAQEQPEMEAQVPVASPVPQRPSRAPPARRTVQDWSRLADELGVVRQAGGAQPSRPEGGSVAPGDAVGAALQTPASTVESLEAPGGPASVRPERMESADGMTEAEPVLLGGETGSADALGEPQEKGPGKRPRKRRHRARKPRGADSGETAVGIGETESPKELAAAESADEEILPAGEPGAPDSLTCDDANERERSEPRRRRRGAGRRKSAAQKGKGSVRPEEGSAAVGEGQPALEQSDREPVETGAADDKDEAAAEAKRESVKDAEAKKGQRGIPSWSEAIGIIVSANLESRAKRPNGKSGSRSRGGRSRGGREKPGEKAS